MKNLTLTLLMLVAATGVQAQSHHRCLHSMEDVPYLPTSQTLATQHRAMSTSTADGLGSYGHSANGVVNSIGEHTIPVIMVEFKDIKFDAGTTIGKVTRLFNEEGYHDEPLSAGSVRDYFVDNSGGMFSPSFEVVAKVTLSNNVVYYGGNTSSSVNKNAKALYQEAVNLAEAAGVDFTPYKEGTAVPMVLLYCAGQGENATRDSDGDKYIWPHFSQTTYTSTANNVKFSSYYMGNEWRKTYGMSNGSIVEVGGQIDGVGVLIHELMHALGMPDEYPTDGNYYETPDFWSVMDYGEYYADSYRPVGLTAYQKSYLGWLDAQELTYAQALELAPGEAAVVRNPANANEYYLLENRQAGTWYPKQNYGTGLLVMHVDYNKQLWLTNKINTTKSHLRMTVLHADGKWKGVAMDGFQLSMLGSDLYGNGVNSIADWHNYTGDMSAMPVFDIETFSDDGDMRFSYIEEGLATAVAQARAEGADATVYTLDGRRAARPASGLYVVGGRKVVLK